jgi:hypothetical protein
MTICSSKGCVRSLTLATLLIALPLGAAQAQRHEPPQIAARSHGRAAAAIVARDV